MSMLENQAAPTARLTASEPYVSAHGRARLVVFLFLAFIAVALFSVFSNLLQLDFLSGEVSEEGAEANDLRQGVVALAYLAVYVALAVAFLLWLHRSARNLPALGNPKSKIEFTPGWAVGWFFVPLANLFMPYKAVREVWEKSDPGIRTEEDLAFTPAASSPLLLGWWVSWIAMNVLSRIAARFEGDAQSIDSLRFVTWVNIVGDVVGIVSALLAVSVVRGIDRRQEERARHVDYVPHTPPPPPVFNQPEPPRPPQGA